MTRLGWILGALVLVAMAVWLAAAPDAHRQALRDDLRTLWGGPTDDAQLDDEDAPSRVELVDGNAIVRLDARQQRASGIGVVPAPASSRLPELRVRARVVDVGPLIELRAHLHAAQAERAEARAAASAAEASVRNLRQLHAEQASVSARAVREAETQMQVAHARRVAAEHRIEDERARAEYRWGEVLVEMALRDTPAFQRLRDRRDVLLLVSLAPRQTRPDTRKALVSRDGSRHGARDAQLVSEAPGTDAIAQGETYFYRTAAGSLRTGMYLDVWIPAPGTPRAGVLIPAAAVVWHAGEPWVYVRRDDGGFVRRSLAGQEETPEGWFVTAGVAPGEQLVVRGGQMLLSEEYRWSIPDEDDDP